MIYVNYTVFNLDVYDISSANVKTMFAFNFNYNTYFIKSISKTIMGANKKLSSVALAAAAATAALIATGFSATATASPVEAMVKCSGINACKGSSACATATNACKGQNSCKGQGWIKASEKECVDKGGKVLG